MPSKESVDKWIKKEAKKKNLPVREKKGLEKSELRERIEEKREEIKELAENKKKLEEKERLTEKERRRLKALPDSINLLREEIKSIRETGKPRSLLKPSEKIGMKAREKAGAGSKLLKDMSKEEYQKYLEEIYKESKRIKGEDRNLLQKLRGEKEVNAADLSIIVDPVEGRILPRTYEELQEGKYKNISEELQRQVNKAAKGNEEAAEATMKAIESMNKSEFRKKLESLKKKIKK